MELEEFKEHCNKKKCLKHQRYDSKTCFRESKQINCHKSYIRLETKKIQLYKETKEEWGKQAEFDNQVWLRDSGKDKGSDAIRKDWYNFCKIWKILTPGEKATVMDDPENHVAESLDIAHIKPKSTALSEKHDLNNVVLVSRLFHRRLTDLVHPITKIPITNDEARLWLESARDGKRKI
jgi:hypothetical protein